MAQNTVLPTVAEKPAEPKLFTLADVQQKILTGKVAQYMVIKTLRKERLKASNSALQNSLKLLLHIAINPKNNGKVLQKLIGVKAGGLSKHLKVLEKTGYLTKIRFQQYALTLHALQVLGNAEQ